jgi:hypothetical protein
VQLCRFADRLPFEHLFDQIDAPARPVELIAEQLESRAGRGAETAVHTAAQNRVGLAPGRRVLDEISKIGLHGQRTLIVPDTSGRG